MRVANCSRADPDGTISYIGAFGEGYRWDEKTGGDVGEDPSSAELT
jgi:hypothetical protein